MLYSSNTTYSSSCNSVKIRLPGVVVNSVVVGSSVVVVSIVVVVSGVVVVCAVV